jgi:hypothetical protein
MTTNGQNAPLNEDRQTIAERERMDMDGLIASGGVPGCARCTEKIQSRAQFRSFVLRRNAARKVSAS